MNDEFEHDVEELRSVLSAADVPPGLGARVEAKVLRRIKASRPPATSAILVAAIGFAFAGPHLQLSNLESAGLLAIIAAAYAAVCAHTAFNRQK